MMTTTSINARPAYYGAATASPLAMGYIGKAFELLGAGLSPVVASRLQAAVASGNIDPQGWESALFRDSLDIAKIRAGDAYAVLGVMAEGWFKIPFHNIEMAPGQRLGHAEHGLVSNLFEFRNNAFHQAQYDDSDAILMLGMAARLLRAFAVGVAAKLVGEYQTELGKQIYAPAPPAVSEPAGIAAEPPPAAAPVPPPALPANAIVTTREALAELLNGSGSGNQQGTETRPAAETTPSPVAVAPAPSPPPEPEPQRPPEPDAAQWANRGDERFRSGDYDQAIADYTRALKLNPSLADCRDSLAQAYNARGDAGARQDDYDQAIADYTCAIKLAPDSAAYRNNRGIACGSSGDYNRAITDFSHAIELNPDDANYWNNRGYTYLCQGDYERAIADCARAVELNPDNPQHRNNLREAQRLWQRSA